MHLHSFQTPLPPLPPPPLLLPPLTEPARAPVPLAVPNADPDMSPGPVLPYPEGAARHCEDARV